MSIAYGLKRLIDIIQVPFILRGLSAHEKWNRQQLQKYQQQRLQSLVKHAIDKSPYHRELYSHMKAGQPIHIEELPIITKGTMMENFDRFVTDPRLRLSGLQTHLEQITHDEYYLGKYRVVTTAGTTGMRGVFAYNRREWGTVLASLYKSLQLHATAYPLRDFRCRHDGDSILPLRTAVPAYKKDRGANRRYHIPGRPTGARSARTPYQLSQHTGGFQ